ncbi:dihydroorotase [Halarsenatibacter silvermanii]|uniref:Dihydroorotase n=1 Tax=Halarsenatibacter silvermanii TaxID=321763 RepID=A0A1G9PTW3_9FIRM|nr:dihydroorotase [Halarsenatibacter silvermanii]SDM02218.1 dihydroorotase [Halarsenatibacter silvermanii]
MNKILLKNINAFRSEDQKLENVDVLIEEDVIAAVESKLETEADDVRIIEAEGLTALPGLIDMHVHFREPGQEHKETIATGTKASARGGFTAAAAMPNTDPVIDKKALVESVYERAENKAKTHLYQVGAVTEESQGEELAEMGRMKEAGIVAVSDDGRPVMNSQVMRLAMEYAQTFDLPVISHAEDENLSAGGMVHEGYYSTLTGLKGIPGNAETIMVARDICLAEQTGCPLHIAHVSTADSVDLISRAKKRGVRVTCEATPHHFTLDHSLLPSYNTDLKVNPPLRSKEDVEAIKQGLADGIIDVIASDHAPHASEEKDVEFDYAPFGISGAETALGLVYTGLIDKGVIDRAKAVKCLSEKPAEILGVTKAEIKTGSPADLTLVAEDKSWQVDPKNFCSKGRNTPFKGRELKGKPVLTLVEGEIAWEEEI